MKKKLKILLPLIFTIIISNLLINFGKVNYNMLIKPNFAPPSWAFALAWSIIYIILYITSISYFKTENSKYSLVLYYLLLGSHIIWNFFFFFLNFKLLAIFILIVVYIISVAYLLSISKKNPKLFYANVLYLLWLIFALILNISFYLLNK